MKRRYVVPLAIAAPRQGLDLLRSASADISVQQSPGQRLNHCYSGAGRATGCPNTDAIRRWRGRIALPPPLTATVPLGRDSSSSRPKRYLRWRTVQLEYLRPTDSTFGRSQAQPDMHSSD